MKLAPYLGVALVASGLALPAGYGATLSPRYTITIPAPGARSVLVSAEFQGVKSGQLTLALVDRSGPGLPSTFDAYKIIPRPYRRQDPTRALAVSVRRRPDINTVFVDVSDPLARGPLDDLVLDYALDLDHALGRSTDPDLASRTYQDRMVVTQDFATLRGDTLFVPQDVALARPRIRVVAPAGWSTVFNAERDGDDFVLPGTYSPRASRRMLRWFGLCGRDLAVEQKVIGTMRWTLVIAPTPAGAQAVSHVVWDRVRHYAVTFGVEALGYVAAPPPTGIGMQNIHLFVIPFPPALGHVNGGLYVPGTAYCFYAPACPETLGHIVAHEYLHAYNPNALRRDEGTHRVNDLWFREGYTEVQATLTNLGLSIADDKERVLAVKHAIAEAWSLAHDRPVEETVAALGLRPTVRSSHSGDAHSSSSRPVKQTAPASARQAPLDRLQVSDLWQDQFAYDRNVEGRSRLVIFGLALALERSRSHRRGLDAWLRNLLDTHGVGRQGAMPLDGTSVMRACLDSSGGSAPELEDFYKRYVSGTSPISLELLARWMSDDAINTVCPRILCRGASGARGATSSPASGAH